MVRPTPGALSRRVRSTVRPAPYGTPEARGLSRGGCPRREVSRGLGGVSNFRLPALAWGNPGRGLLVGLGRGGGVEDGQGFVSPGVARGEPVSRALFDRGRAPARRNVLASHARSDVGSP